MRTATRLAATRMVLRNLERQPVRSAASSIGIVLRRRDPRLGLVFSTRSTCCCDIQFSAVQRQDVTVTFVEPASSAALPRASPACPAWSTRSRSGRAGAHPPRAPSRDRGDPGRRRARAQSDRGVALRRRTLPPDGLVLSKSWARCSSERRRVVIEVLEGAPGRRRPSAALVEDDMGVGLHGASARCIACCARAGTLSRASCPWTRARDRRSTGLKETPASPASPQATPPSRASGRPSRRR